MEIESDLRLPRDLLPYSNEYATKKRFLLALMENGVCTLLHRIESVDLLEAEPKMIAAIIEKRNYSGTLTVYMRLIQTLNSELIGDRQIQQFLYTG